MIARRKWIYQAMKFAEKQRYSEELGASRAVLKAYRVARREHCFLLRCEGLTLRQIGDRLGITATTVSMHIYKEGRRLARAMRRTRYWIV